MSSVLDAMAKSDTVHYYDPSQNKNVKLVARQLYPSHITECKVAEVSVRKKYKAKVFNFFVEIADEVKDLTFINANANGKEVKGTSFAGRRVKGGGVFFFLNPTDGDDFEANPGGNDKYLHFCESLGIECPEVEVDIDGEKRIVKTLPELEAEDIIGKPLMSYIDIAPWKDKDGNQRNSMNVKNFDKWSDGSDRDIAGEDLPF